MSWANLVKKSIPISSKSILTNYEKEKVQTENLIPEPIISTNSVPNLTPISTLTTSNPQQVSLPCNSCNPSRIRLASLKECLEYRRSGNPKQGIYYPGVLGKSSTSLSEFYQRHQRQLQWLYKNQSQSWARNNNRSCPSFSSFIVLAWIFSN